MARGITVNDMTRAERARMNYLKKVGQEQARREKAVISAQQRAMAQQQRMALRMQKEQLKQAQMAQKQAAAAAYRQNVAAHKAQQDMLRAQMGLPTTRRRKYY